MILKSLSVSFLIASLFFVSISQQSYGHGVGFEILPPVKVDDRLISLEVSTTEYADPKNPNKQVSFVLFDVDSTLSLKDVTFHVTGKKAHSVIFDQTFTSKYGVLVLELIPSNDAKVKIEEKSGGFFESLVGTSKKDVAITGPQFNSGGLYQFDVAILTMDSFSNKLSKPILFNVGLSIPDTTYHKVNDPNFGEQLIEIITYYDQIKNFEYDYSSRSIKFSMPFEWNVSNINQTEVVHEELVVSKAFGDMMVPKYSVFVNGIQLSDSATTIDEFSYDFRILHIIINQKELLDLAEKIKPDTDKMDFLVRPASDTPELSTVTGNGQFRINLSWEPHNLRSGDTAKFYVDIRDVFLSNKKIDPSYALLITNNDKEIFTHNHSTSDKTNMDSFELKIPNDVSGPLLFNFRNLGGNSAARITIPVVVDRIQVSNNDARVVIPDWIKGNAGWWADGQIDDAAFVSGIQFMIKQKIILIPDAKQTSEETDSVPGWVKNNAGWWSQDLISDDDFVMGLKFLIEKGIIKI